MLTEDQSNNLERVQKTALKIVLQKSQKSQNYQKSLNTLQLDSLKNRREKLCLIFAQKCQTNTKMKDFFQKNKNHHIMQTRNPEHFQTQFANTERLKKSPIIYMQGLLNNEAKK